MKHIKTSVGSVTSQEAPQASITEQATLVSLEAANALEKDTDVTKAIDIRDLLNRHLNAEDKAIVQQAVAAYPDKVAKIAVYANKFSGADLARCLGHSAF
jgi:hypothetical protein